VASRRRWPLIVAGVAGLFFRHRMASAGMGSLAGRVAVMVLVVCDSARGRAQVRRVGAYWKYSLPCISCIRHGLCRQLQRSICTECRGCSVRCWASGQLRDRAD
jgi:hypothetical protein